MHIKIDIMFEYWQTNEAPAAVYNRRNCVEGEKLKAAEPSQCCLESPIRVMRQEQANNQNGRNKQSPAQAYLLCARLLEVCSGKKMRKDSVASREGTMESLTTLAERRDSRRAGLQLKKLGHMDAACVAGFREIFRAQASACNGLERTRSYLSNPSECHRRTKAVGINMAVLSPADFVGGDKSSPARRGCKIAEHWKKSIKKNSYGALLLSVGKLPPLNGAAPD